jgi:hypothetical protein
MSHYTTMPTFDQLDADVENRIISDEQACREMCALASLNYDTVLANLTCLCPYAFHGYCEVELEYQQ